MGNCELVRVKQCVEVRTPKIYCVAPTRSGLGNNIPPRSDKGRRDQQGCHSTEPLKVQV